MIRGKGDVFCAGLDMAERSESAFAGEASGIEVMLRAIELCPLPVVAVVQGDAIAGGNELALALRPRGGQPARRASACRLPRSAWRPTGSWPRS